MSLNYLLVTLAVVVATRELNIIPNISQMNKDTKASRMQAYRTHRHFVYVGSS